MNRCLAGRCCAQDANVYCAACGSNAGTCILCTQGRSLVNGVCVGDGGLYCRSGADCTSGDCRQGVCCLSDIGPNCDQCGRLWTDGVPGACSGCTPGFYLHSDTSTCRPVLLGGEACMEDNNCQSSACLGGFCCSDSVTSFDCTACNDRGLCTECYSWAELYEGACREPPGSSCGSDRNCMEGLCLGGVCCVLDVGPECSSCGYSAGGCSACVPGYFFSNDTCVPGARTVQRARLSTFKTFGDQCNVVLPLPTFAHHTH